MTFAGNLNLAIDTTFAGGSISLMNGSEIVDFRIGQNKLSKSADILSGIDSILRKNNLRMEDLDRFFVAVGPGSYTGIRIGLAFALGFCKNHRCRPTGVSVLEAMKYMDFGHIPEKKRVFCYLHNLTKAYVVDASDNKQEVNRLIFNKKTLEDNIKIHSFEQFIRDFSRTDKVLCVYSTSENCKKAKKLVLKLELNLEQPDKIRYETDLNLAKYIGIAGEKSSQTVLKPLYL